jgi:8-oxo-dGTP diphosphatase
VLGPVQPTRSHPGVPGLGWERFAEWVEQANLPVYALGGVGPEDTGLAQASGARGVAGIRLFFSSTVDRGP